MVKRRRRVRNFFNVMNFEISRTLKKSSFWTPTFILPAVIAFFMGVSFFSSNASQQAVVDLQNEKFSFMVMDESGVVSDEYVESLGGSFVDDKDIGVSEVEDQKIEAFYYYPNNLDGNSVEIYAKEDGIFGSNKYGEFAKSLLYNSISDDLTSNQVLSASGNATTVSTLYRDGVAYNIFKEMAVPAIFVLMFLSITIISVGQMLVSATEEKENRTMEILMVSVPPQAILAGKIFAMLILSAIQVLATIGMLLIIALGVFIFGVEYFNVGAVSTVVSSGITSGFEIDYLKVFIGLFVVVVSLLMFSAIIAMIGALSPNAKDANMYTSIVLMTVFGPLYGVSIFVSSPEHVMTIVLTYFPLSSPLALLVRNAVGNLQVYEFLISGSILLATTLALFMVVSKVFKAGSLGVFSQVVNFKFIKKHKK